tara:strand:- start:9479 stop:9847 length:369 start_codon:yes stop_codon:yes gene_type:complete
MAQAFTNTTDINGLSYNINHVQNKTNIQDPSKYDYAPGADIDIYNIVSKSLSSFMSFLVITLNMIKKKIYNGYLHLKQLFQSIKEYSIYFIILVIVIVILYKFIYKEKPIVYNLEVIKVDKN